MHAIKNLLVITLLSIGIACFAAETIDINSADKETLMSVKGVGERRAEAIIDYREKFGPFNTVDQLMEVEGIGESTLDANRDILMVNRRK